MTRCPAPVRTPYGVIRCVLYVERCDYPRHRWFRLISWPMAVAWRIKPYWPIKPEDIDATGGTP